jgi:hypothetical protein
MYLKYILIRFTPSIILPREGVILKINKKNFMYTFICECAQTCLPCMPPKSPPPGKPPNYANSKQLPLTAFTMHVRPDQGF